MSDDRRAQANAEATRQSWSAPKLRAAFRAGAAWADANPQPHTVSADDVARTAEKAYERWGELISEKAFRILIRAHLADLGIKVTD